MKKFVTRKTFPNSSKKAKSVAESVQTSTIIEREPRMDTRYSNAEIRTVKQYRRYLWTGRSIVEDTNQRKFYFIKGRKSAYKPFFFIGPDRLEEYAPLLTDSEARICGGCRGMRDKSKKRIKEYRNLSRSHAGLQKDIEKQITQKRDAARGLKEKNYRMPIYSLQESELEPFTLEEQPLPCTQNPEVMLISHENEITSACAKTWLGEGK